ncbi:MAG TPA: hypothetical protein VGZ22_17245 [Isosphaeraceae bacterium]|jgi:hypothetical protein|nr:hypothetical protein [Isosphaeraceae bacterium]
MRTGRRKLLAALGIALLGTAALAAPGDQSGSAPPVRLTVEVDWTLPGDLPAAPLAASFPFARAAGVELELSEGRIVAAATKSSEEWVETEMQPEALARSCQVGSGPTGRARVRLEAPVGANLLVRAGAQVVRVPILAILEGPQRTSAQAPVNVGVERLPWDSIELSLGEGDGMVAPGSTVPVNLAFNVLTPEPTEVMVRATAELRPLRGADPVWRQDERKVVCTNAIAHPGYVVPVAVPQAEGTYVLEIRTSLEPIAGREGSRLGRWLRSKRRGAAMAPTSVRRVTLAVVDSKSTAPLPAPTRADAVVDAIDLARPRGHRVMASGRAPPGDPDHFAWAVPEAALVDARRLDLLRGLINRGNAEVTLLGPADAMGLAWSAVGLKVAHPGRPHRLTLTVTGGYPSALGVALVAPGGPSRGRVLLDACASGLPILEGGPMGSFSWLVWPDADEPVLVLVNRNSAAAVRLGTVELTELADLPPPPNSPETPGEATRSIGLHLVGPNALDRFGGGTDCGLSDTLVAARNLAAYLSSCGATNAILPEQLAVRERRTLLEGQMIEDAIGPDVLDLVLLVLERRGLAAWLDLDCHSAGALPGLPEAGSPEALASGIVRVDRQGNADGGTYHPLHPDVQEALKQRVLKSIAMRKKRPSLAGLLIRLGPGPTLLGGPDTGFDDATFARFVRATGLETVRNVPGLGTDDPNRFAARGQFLAGPGRMPWLTWRVREIGSLYAELARAVNEAAPGAILAVATPSLDDSPAGEEAHRADLAGLPPHDAWRAVGLDLEHWPTGTPGLVVLRGVGLSSDDLGHDLATSPELDAQVASQPRRGLLLSANTPPRPRGDGGSASSLLLTASPMAEGAAGDEPLGHALAALDARWAFLSATAAAGQEERLRRFATVFRALPVQAEAGSPVARGSSGVAVRAIETNQQTYLSLANDTPYPIRLETVLHTPASASIVDLGRGLRLAPESVAGGKRLVIDLAPFGVAAMRVGAPGVQVASVTPHHPSAVLATLEARKDDLSRTLARLDRSSRSGGSGPANPGFEPNIELTGVREAPRPNGWHAGGEPSATVVIDPVRPRSGQGSLRLDAPAPPASVVSDSFVPPGGQTLSLRAWIRSDRSNTPVRVRLEGEQAGRSFVQQAELTAQPQWAAVTVPISGLPPGGLDHARLRFELPGSGRLWLDDLAVSGEGLSEPERRNARRILLAAILAYRERRYADFARLASSHWARQAEPDPRIAGLDPERTTLRSSPSDASALPPGRRLR